MGSLERNFELLNALSDFGDQRNDRNLLVRPACDAFLTDKDWVLKFTTQNHLHHLLEGLSRLLNSVFKAFKHERLGLLLLFDVLELDFRKHITTGGIHGSLKNDNKFLGVEGQKIENHRMLQFPSGGIFNGPSLEFVLRVYRRAFVVS